MLVIPESELEISYVRSSGPGGQNVNKVNSKAVLRWDAAGSAALAAAGAIVRARVLSRLGPRLTREGHLVISGDNYRDQGRNRQDCVDRLRELVAEAAVPPKIRRKTKPTRGSRERTHASKRRQGEKKASRRKPGFE